MKQRISVALFTLLSLIGFGAWMQNHKEQAAKPEYSSSMVTPAVYHPGAPEATAASVQIVPVVVKHRNHRGRRVVLRRRKFSHSAAIVGGSAAGGAAIGALAGGGKGAAIGALAGGGAGLVYDRATDKKVRRVPE